MVDSDKSFSHPLPELGGDDDEILGGYADSDMLGGPEPLSNMPIPTPLSYKAPPERVRFTVPAVLSFDGYEETFEATVTNLSAQGVGLLGPQGLAVQDKLRLRFRLALSADPQKFLCQVIWVHNRDDEEADYGLRFVDLENDQAQEVLAAVRERTEGRASEWTMPLMPPDPPAVEPVLDIDVAPPPPMPRTSPWMAAAAGMAAGIGLALVLAALTTTSPEPTVVTPSPAPGAAERADLGNEPSTDVVAPALAAPPVIPELVPVVPPPATAAAAHGLATPGGTATTPAPSGVVTPAPSVPTPAEAHPGRQPALHTEPPAHETAHVAPAASPAAPVGLHFDGNADRAVMTLTTDGPVSEQQVFWLNNPLRLVVDLPGRQSRLERKLYELNSPLVHRVRVGQHPGKVRFVIETTPSVGRKFSAKRIGNTVRVELRRNS